MPGQGKISSEEMRRPMQPDRPVKLTRHADHDPSLVCRPALGYGLCEVLEVEDGSEDEDGGAS